MTRVISNTFSITAQKDVTAARANLVHCSLFQQDRLGWWELPYNAIMSFVEYGRYGYEGYNAYGVLAKPGQISDLKQCLAITKKDSVADYNKEGSNIFALQGGKWYTLSFNALGNGRKFNSDGTITGENTNESTMYVYLVGRTDTGYVSVVDSSAGYIVDGVNKTVPHDLSTPIKIRWQWESHTITFKTSSAIGAIPMLHIRSFGQGYNDEFADGGCLYRIACVKLEEGMEATAFTPHATEMQPPVHAIAFKRDNTDISGTTPSGGTYTSPTPTGWSDGIPSGEARLWETKAVFVPELPSATWSKPSPVGDTSDSDVEFSPYDGTPASDVLNNLAAAGTAATSTTNKWFDPARNVGADFSKMIWRAERQKKNGTWGSWAIVKVKGETGEKGDNGKDAVTLDLDNEMDSVVCDNNGYLLAKTTIQTTLRLYDGASLKAMPSEYATLNTSSLLINGVEPTATPSDDNMTCTLTWEFGAGLGFSSDRYTADVSILYNGTYYLATFTLNAMRNGKNGEPAVLCQLAPSHTALTYRRDGYGSLTGSNTLTCNIKKTVGGITSESSSISGYNIYYGYNDSTPSTILSSGIIISHQTVLNKSLTQVVLELWKGERNAAGATRVDRETIPVLTDGQKGESGDPGAPGEPGAPGAAGVSIDFFASANTIMMGDAGIEPSSINFKATMAYGDGEPSAIWSSTYSIVVREYDSNGNNTETNNYKETGSYSCDYTHSISNKTTLTKLVAELQKNGTVIRTLTIPVVKKGADGRSYNPVPRGIWTSGETYKWDDKQRDYVDCEFSGVYYRFGVKTYDTKVTAKPTSDQGDENWEVCNRVSCLITNCIFGTNAVIGGFVATAGKFMSTENAYALRYFGSFDSINSLLYRGTWSSGNTYSANHLVLYNGVYYYSVISNNTSTPSSSSLSWSKCNDVWKVRINEASPSVGQTIYLYEYDNATLKRPVVKDGSTYYTIKKMGAATATPTSSNSNWRELTDIELSFLNVGNGTETTPVVSYVPKYTLNGKNGTVMMLQADDTCWTYDDTGKQVNGIPYGKRIEIVPASKSIDVYDDNGKLALQVNGDTYETIDKAYGSGTLNPSCSGVSGSLSSSNEGSSKTALLFLTSSSGFEVENHPLNLSVTSACNVTASEYRTTTTPNGNYGGIYAVPSNVDNLWVYRNDCRGMLMVQRLNNNGTWSNHNLLVSISTVGISGTTARYSGTTFCVLQPGTYRLVFIFSAELFGMLNTGGNQTECDYKVTNISASGNYAIETSRVFANGLAFGSATNDNFVVVRESGGIHVKAATKTNGHGFELSQTKGLEVKRDGYQGASLPVLFVARTTYLSENAKKEYEYLYWNEALGKPTMTWTARGVCEITLGSDYPTSEHIMPTLTSYAAPEMGVSARIKSWRGQKIIIELDSDYNSPNDYGGFYIKLEYIGKQK